MPERFRPIIEAAPGGILLVNRDGVIVLVNGRLESLFGYTTNELVGSPVELLIPERFREHHVGFRHSYFANPSARPMGTRRDLAARRKDGSEFPVEIGLNYTLIDSEIYTLAFVTDITERKRAEALVNEALAREQAAHAKAIETQVRLLFLLGTSTLLSESLDFLTRLRLVADLCVPNIADWCAVHLVDPEGKVTQVALTHADPAKIASVAEFQKRFPPDPNAPRGIYEVLRTGKAELHPAVTDELLHASTNDAEWVRLARELEVGSVMIVPLIASNSVLGTITLVAAESHRTFGLDDLELASDLARQVAMLIENARLYDEAQKLNAELEARVLERTAELQAANKELEAFSYSISHDLRAPLRALDGFSRILLRDFNAQLPPEGQRYLNLVRKNAQEMGKLIDDLLTFSRLGRQPLTKEPVSITNLVRHVLVDMSSEQENRQIEISVGDLPVCLADPALLKQVLVNLLANAFKFTRKREAARIEIGSRPIEGQLAYFVKDNGAGFDMQYASKLFGVFQRLHSAEDYEGTGVGLAIVQRVIHRHGGRVWAESAVDQGATFYFTLPGIS